MIYTDGTPDFARPHKRLEVRHGQEVVVGEEISEQELDKLQAFAAGFACGMGEPSETVSRPR